MNFYTNYFKSLIHHFEKVDNSLLFQLSEQIIETRNRKGKVIIVGNGGSSAIASHVSIDLTKAAGVRTINFNEASLLTCFSNDYGYKFWVEKALEFYADDNDMVILISSSGKSENILNGAKKAKLMELPLVAFSGFSPDNPLKSMGDINFWVDSNIYNFVEITHEIWLLSVVDYLISQPKKIVNPYVKRIDLEKFSSTVNS